MRKQIRNSGNLTMKYVILQSWYVKQDISSNSRAYRKIFTIQKRVWNYESSSRFIHAWTQRWGPGTGLDKLMKGEFCSCQKSEHIVQSVAIPSADSSLRYLTMLFCCIQYSSNVIMRIKTNEQARKWLWLISISMERLGKTTSNDRTAAPLRLVF